uniref:uncharacterized protein LOC120327284 n=1 Tax=Styela clava TaxID=7725 RepID=UPI001939280E|nr:uncharacterized protein LOC120327284 [Styela clava]
MKFKATILIVLFALVVIESTNGGWRKAWRKVKETSKKAWKKTKTFAKKVGEKAKKALKCTFTKKALTVVGDMKALYEKDINAYNTLMKDFNMVLASSLNDEMAKKVADELNDLFNSEQDEINEDVEAAPSKDEKAQLLMSIRRALDRN